MDLSDLKRLGHRSGTGGWGLGGLHETGLEEVRPVGVGGPWAASGTRASDAGEPGNSTAIAALIRDALSADQVVVREVSALTGGAIHAHHAIDLRAEGGTVPGDSAWVIRFPADPSFRIGHPPDVEAAVMRRAARVGVPVPEVLKTGQARAPGSVAMDRPYLIMRRVVGRAVASELVGLGTADGVRVGRRAGEVLGRLHGIAPDAGVVDGLIPPPEDPAGARLANLSRALDATGAVEPGLEWVLAWLTRNRPAPVPPRLVHGDFRSGNLMIDGGSGKARLVAVLDWEFARWSDPHEDLGWLSAPCWRYGRRDRPVGGFADWASFEAGYRAAGGVAIEPARLRFWQVLALLNWAIIALGQAGRFRRDRPETLDLGLTGWRLPELLFEMLRATAPEARAEGADAPPPASDAVVLPAPVPGVEDLLHAVRRALSNGLPAGPEEMGLLINAIGIAERATAAGGMARAGADWGDRARSIRRDGIPAGRSAAHHGRLLAETRARLTLANPRYLIALGLD
ncbi:phosphotransferase family protein [Marivibrio halodurans]|uniref:Phosphotransferase family protein n=1 Tax=Marivibrio halodurans TaxID=2039722 RepID=A0A8J7S2G2_9PROT|nr:phosphotransferase family protein [Marivibrio halodurans]MBP5855489.1 phosphotransferase family protein [Marivibrio halodurans]